MLSQSFAEFLSCLHKEPSCRSLIIKVVLPRVSFHPKPPTLNPPPPKFFTV